MDLNSGRAAFSKSSNYTQLRRPHENCQGTSGPSQGARSSGVLSANAPEFVPQFSSNTPPAPKPNPHKNSEHHQQNIGSMKGASVQNRLNVKQCAPGHHMQMQAMNQPNSNQYVNFHHENYAHGIQAPSPHNNIEILNRDHYSPANNRNDQNNAVHPNFAPQENSELANEETFAINYIQSIVKCLNDNPGSFDSIAARALSMFEGFGENEYVLSNAMEIIFNKSIDEQNFRYMGAKLYNLLDLIDLRKDSLFRNLLNLKLTYHQSELLKFMQNEQCKVRGTTLFLAELYMQLRNDGCQIKDIAQNIVFSIKQLLLKITPENIKCICLTLKLAGYDLEKDCQNDIFEIISNLRTVNALDVSTSRILETVLNLQKNRWGRNVEPLDHTHTIELIRTTDEPVFYGPDGQILTDEENSFLESSLFEDGNNGDELVDSDIEFDPEMDAEMEKAYKDFLKNSCKKSD